jgi:hypothetical protein
MARIIQSVIDITQALADIPALNNSTTLSFQTQGGVEGELGIVNPTVAGITTTPLNFDCDGQFVTCIVRLRTDDVNPVYFTTLTAGAFTFTVTYDDPLIPPATGSVDLPTLQSQGDVSDSEMGLFGLPAHIRAGGKTRIFQDIAFNRTVVSIGSATTSTTQTATTAVGSEAIIDATLNDAGYTTIIGAGARATETPDFSVIVGPQGRVVQGCNRSTAIGFQSDVSSGSPESTAVGQWASVNTNSAGSVSVGFQATCSNDSSYAIAVGNQARVLNGSLGGIAMGSGAFLNTFSPRSVAIGYGANGTTSTESVIVGTRARARTGTPRTVVMGFEADCRAPHSVVLGFQVSSDNLSSTNSVVIGTNASLSGPNTFVTLIGVRADMYGSSSDHSVAIGFQAVCNQGSVNAVVLGDDAKVQDSCDGSIAIGHQASIDQNSIQAIAIGDSAIITNAARGSAAFATAIGRTITNSSLGAILLSPTSGFIDDQSSLSVAIGYFATTTTSPAAFVLGAESHATGSQLTTIVGPQSTSDGAANSLILGYGNTIADNGASPATDANARHAIGASNIINGDTAGTSTFGIDNQVTAGQSMVFGHGNRVSNTKIRIAGIGCLCNTTVHTDMFIFGQNIDAVTNFASGSITMGTGAVAVERVFAIGSSTYLPGGASAIRTFNVRGYNGGAIDTISATDNPADPTQVGLVLVLNTGASFVNRTVYAVETPPVGSLLLHVNP